MYQQFAVTMAVSVLISAFNALSLSPALGALLLRPGARSFETMGSAVFAGLLWLPLQRGVARDWSPL